MNYLGQLIALGAALIYHKSTEISRPGSTVYYLFGGYVFVYRYPGYTQVSWGRRMANGRRKREISIQKFSRPRELAVFFNRKELFAKRLKNPDPNEIKVRRKPGSESIYW